MPVHRYKYFSSSDAARVSKLQFTARQVVEGIITGLHKSPHRGFSVEFSEHREYVPGDELRHLDWRAYARSDRFYIKLYEQETNLRATLVIDNSASMRFGAKIDYARHLAACLAYLLSIQQDLAGLVALDNEVKISLPPGSAPSHLDMLFRALETVEVGRGADLPKHLHALSEQLPRKSMVILISDLWLEPADLTRALQHMRYRGHQVLILHLLDQAEMDLPYDRQVTLMDLETEEKIQVDPAELRSTYQEQVQAYLSSVRRSCTDSGAEYHSIMVQVPYERALTQLMSRRAR